MEHCTVSPKDMVTFAKVPFNTELSSEFPPVLQPGAKSACGSFTQHLLIGGNSIWKKMALLPKGQGQVTLIFQVGHSLFK